MTVTTSLTATELTELGKLVASLEGVASELTAKVDLDGCEYVVRVGYDEDGTFGLLDISGVSA